VRNLIGCNMSFRRGVFGEVGGFASRLGRLGSLPLGCEETELCIRIGQHAPDLDLVYDPELTVRHHVPRTRATWRYFLSRCHAEGISKAEVTRLAGRDSGLATERSYAARTLPAGVWSGVVATCTGRDASGLARAGAIVAGLGATTAGYVRGVVARRVEARA
jgi:O-antigen biosynthesis protein